MLIEKSSHPAEYPERSRYSFDDMSVGDCMHFDEFKRAENARIAAIQFSKRNRPAWKFSIRKMSDGWRIFRVC